jgi:hypothetical protein
MKTSKVSQRQVLEYTGTFARLQMELTRAYEPGEEPVAAAGGAQTLEIMSVVSVSMGAEQRLTLEWEASPVADAIVEHIVAIVADIELKPGPPPAQETESEAEVE